MNSRLPRIVFPEPENPLIQEAAARAKTAGICAPIFAPNLESAAKMLADNRVDGMVAGIDHTTRDVILAAREFVGIAPNTRTFSSFFALEFPENAPGNWRNKTIILADGGVVKNPTTAQLADIAVLTNAATCTILRETPRLALLSFSTFGSGGNDDSITKLRETLRIVRAQNPEILIDGEMQLDAAVNLQIAAKKAPNSDVAGRANVLILPDLNAGNILYKALEQFAGAHAFGPILTGFAHPISDLSRGSTVEDIYGCIKIIAAQISKIKERSCDKN